MTLGPIVVHEHDSHDDLIETHTFPDGDAFIAWIDSQDLTMNLLIEPRDEFLSVREFLA